MSADEVDAGLEAIGRQFDRLGRDIELLMSAGEAVEPRMLRVEVICNDCGVVAGCRRVALDDWEALEFVCATHGVLLLPDYPYSPASRKAQERDEARLRAGRGRTVRATPRRST